MFGQSFSISGINVNANIATATADTANYAYVENAHLTVSGGDLQITVDGTSYADAIIAGGSSVSLYDFGLTLMYAYANGDYQAYLNAPRGKA